MSKNNNPGITNLTEAGVAVAKLLKSYTAAAADGSVSIFEWVKIGIGNAGDILAAIQDASHIFPEVMDLTPLEFEEFYFAVISDLELPDNGAARRRVGKIYDLVHAALVASREWVDETSNFDSGDVPRAEIVPDLPCGPPPENYLDTTQAL
jgi:hypothetical protein